MKHIKKLLPKTKFLLALSGGVDSMSTAIHLIKLKKDFIAFHYNGNFIEQDLHTEKKVREFCFNNNIPLVVETGTNTYKTGSKEEYCRKARYSAIANTCNEYNFRHVVTAHNLDDCVTSYMWNCLRGKCDYNPLPFETTYPEFTLTRPYLLVSKDEMRKYGVDTYPTINNYIVEDELNSDVTLTRNFIGKVVVPLIHSKKHFNLNTVVRKIVEKKLKNFLDNKETPV